MEFSRPEYWSGEPFSSSGDLNLGIEPRSPTLQVDSLLSKPLGKLRNPVDLPDPEIELESCRRILYQLSYQGSQIEIQNSLTVTPLSPLLPASSDG